MHQTMVNMMNDAIVTGIFKNNWLTHLVQQLESDG